MEEQTIANVRLRVAEHIIAQYNCPTNNDVQNILTETKVGAWKRPTLLKIIKMVFPTA